MKIGIDLGSYFIKASRLSLEGFPMAIQDGFTKLNYSLNCVEKVENGFLVGYDFVAAASPQKLNLVLTDAPQEVCFTDQASAPWPIETLLALILKKIKADIDTTRVESVNFAVPMGLNEVQKKVFYDAALLANITQSSLIETPLAAIAYHKIQHLNTVLVIDWGYSGLKITAVRKQKDTYQIVKHQEVKNIGGNIFTQKLADIVLDNFEKRFGYALSQFKDKAAKIAEDLKIELSVSEYASQDIIIDGELVNITMYRQAFEASIKTDLDAGVEAIKKMIDESGYSSTQIEAVVLAGGCVSTPCVKRRLKATFTEIKKWYDNEPLLAIAMGASVFDDNNIPQKNVASNTPEFSQQQNLVKNTAVNGLI